MPTTIFRNQFPDTFTPPTNQWTTYSGGTNNYSGLPSSYLPWWYYGECIQVAVAGTMHVSGSIGAGRIHPYSNGGAQFYGIGTNDPLKQLIPDDSTYAYDTRDVTHEVEYVLASAAAAEDGYFPLLTIAKGLFDDVGNLYVAVYGDGNGSQSRTYEVNYTTWASGSLTRNTVGFGSGAPFDDTAHRLKVVAVPGTIAGDPHNGSSGWTAASDGSISIYLDGSLLESITGIALVFASQLGSGTSFQQDPVMMRSVWLGADGLAGDVTDLYIYRADSAPTTPTATDDSTPCCGSTVDSSTGGTTAGGSLGEDPSLGYQGWTPACDGGGTVPTASDPTDSETFDTGSPAKNVSGLELVLTVQRDSGTDTSRHSTRPFAGAVPTDAKVMSWGQIRREVSDDQGSVRMAQAQVTVNDDDGTLRQAIAENPARFYANTEAHAVVLSDAGRAAALSDRFLMRGRIDDVNYGIDHRDDGQRVRTVDLTITDALAPYYDQPIDVPLMNRTDLPQIPKDLENKPYPVIYGEHSDAGVVDVNGNSAEKGLVPALFVGYWDAVDFQPAGSKPQVLNPPSGLTYTVNGTPGTRTLYYGVTKRSALGETTIGNIVEIDTAPTTLDGTNNITLDWSADADPEATAFILYRGDYPTPSARIAVLDASTLTYTDDGTAPALPPGPPDVNSAIRPNVDGDLLFRDWGLFVIGLGEAPITAVFASDLNAGAAPKRININDTEGVDFIAPGFRFWDIYGPGANVVTIGGVDVTCIMVRGPRLQQHLDGVVTIAVDCCGRIGVNGNPIDQAFPILQHLLTQYVPTDGGSAWRTGADAGLRLFADSTPTLKSSAFTACQDLSKTFLGNTTGYKGHLYISEPLTTRELLAWFCQGLDMIWTTTHHGQGAPQLLDPYTDPSDGSVYRERVEIVELGAPTLDRSSLLPVQKYQYDYDPDAQTFRSEVEHAIDADALDLVGGQFRDPGVLQVRVSRDADTVRDAQRRRVQRLKYPRWMVPLTTQFNGVEDELCNQVVLTHRDAPDLDGWTDRPCYIESHVVDGQTKLVTLTCVDKQPLLDAYAENVMAEDDSVSPAVDGAVTPFLMT